MLILIPFGAIRLTQTFPNPLSPVPKLDKVVALSKIQSFCKLRNLYLSNLTVSNLRDAHHKQER